MNITSFIRMILTTFALILTQGVYPELMVTPNNTVVLAGEALSLKCRSTSEVLCNSTGCYRPVQWFGKGFVDNAKVGSTTFGSFYIKNETKVYSLNINSTRLIDIGVYRCEDVKYRSSMAAYVNVLYGIYASYSSNGGGLPNWICEDNFVSFHCGVDNNYITQIMTPVIRLFSWRTGEQWNDSNDDSIISLVQRRVVVYGTAATNGFACQCQVWFNRPPRQTGMANNTPSFNRSAGIPSLGVLVGPISCRIIASPTSLQCSADGDPPPNMYTWLNCDGNIIGNGTTLLLTNQMFGQIYTCVVGYDKCWSKNNTATCTNVPVIGQWSPWSPGSCSVSCGTGEQRLSRVCNNPAVANKSRPCVGDSFRYQMCFMPRCTEPVNGQWGTWSLAGSCSVSCGTGTQQVGRVCNNPPPTNKGQPCVGDSFSSQQCVMRPCAG